MVLATILTVFSFAVSNAQDPDLPDSIIILDIAIDSAQTSAIMPVYAVTDDAVAFFNIPLNVNAAGGGFAIENVSAVSDQIAQWDELFSDYFVDDDFLRLFGIWDTGLEDNPVLNTDYQRVHILDLIISIEPGAPDQYVTIENTVDPIGGPILLGLDDGTTEFTPAFKSGLITFGNPTGIDDDETTKPVAFGLKQNYPNPFNPETTIDFSLDKPAEIRLEVFNLLGQRVDQLAAGFYQTGTYSVIWSARGSDGSELPSGIYFYTLSSGSNFESGKMILLR